MKIRKTKKIIDSIKNTIFPDISLINQQKEFKKRLALKQNILTVYATKVSYFTYKIHMMNRIIKEKTMNKENGLLRLCEEKIKFPNLLVKLSKVFQFN